MFHLLVPYRFPIGPRSVPAQLPCGFEPYRFPLENLSVPTHEECPSSHAGPRGRYRFQVYVLSVPRFDYVGTRFGVRASTNRTPKPGTDSHYISNRNGPVPMRSNRACLVRKPIGSIGSQSVPGTSTVPIGPRFPPTIGAGPEPVPVRPEPKRGSHSRNARS